MEEIAARTFNDTGTKYLFFFFFAKITLLKDQQLAEKVIINGSCTKKCSRCRANKQGSSLSPPWIRRAHGALLVKQV